jgi:hypothetical protein
VPATPASQTQQSSVRVLYIALVLLAALLLLPGLAVGPSLDAAVFAGIGEQIRAGDRLYVDAWDHKPPAAYFVLAVAQAALAWLSPWIVSWLVSVLATAGAGLGIAYAVVALGARRWAGYLAAALAVAFLAQYLTALGGGLTEPMAALPASWALALVLSQPQTAWRRFGAGLLLGLATLISLQLAPAVIAAAGICLASVDPRLRIRAAIDLAVGIVGPWVLAGLALLAAGGLGAAVDAVFTYGAAYRTSSSAFGAELSRAPAAWTFLSSLALVAPAALGGLALLKTGDRRRSVPYAMAAWIALALALFAFQGRFIAHYAVPLAIPLGLLAGVGLSVTADRWARAGTRVRVALALPLVAALLASVAAGFLGGRYELLANLEHSRQVDAAAQYVEGHSGPGDEILVWGNRPELYLAAERVPAIPYRFMYPLTTEGYVSADLVARVRSDLSEDPPLLVVDAGSDRPGAPGFLQLLIDRPVAQEGREMDLLGPLRDYIRANYHLLTVVDGWPIYRLRPASSPDDG